MQRKELSRIEEKGTFIFMEEFTQQSVERAIRFITYHNYSENPPDYLQFIIQSPGGDANALFALVDTINNSQIPVSTLALGQVASCGTLLLCSGAKGSRYVSSTCMVMSHQYSWGSQGKYADMKNHRIPEDFYHSIMAQHYRINTGLSMNDIKKKLLPHEDVWLTPTEAVELGLADKVIDFYEKRK